jgi:hypothetical protein
METGWNVGLVVALVALAIGVGLAAAGVYVRG